MDHDRPTLDMPDDVAELVENTARAIASKPWQARYLIADHFRETLIAHFDRCNPGSGAEGHGALALCCAVLALTRSGQINPGADVAPVGHA